MKDGKERQPTSSVWIHTRSWNANKITASDVCASLSRNCAPSIRSVEIFMRFKWFFCRSCGRIEREQDWSVCSRKHCKHESTLRRNDLLHTICTTWRQGYLNLKMLAQRYWLSCCFTSHSTQNRSFRRRFPKPISWLGLEKNKPNTTKERVHQSKYLYYTK